MEGAPSAPLPDGKAVAITVVRGPDAGAKYELTQARIVIGRKRGDVVVKDRETSSLHASIEQAPDGRFILKDLGSTNGTWLEGKRITVAEILPGQHLKVGANHLLFSVAELGSEATAQGMSSPDPDVSFPSPWSGGGGEPSNPVLPPLSAGPLDVDLGMPDLPGAPPPALARERAEAIPAPPPEAPVVSVEPVVASLPPAPAAPWPAPPPMVSPGWPAAPPVLASAPEPTPVAMPRPPSPPVDPLSRTTPGISARTLPDAQRSDVAPPLPSMPAWPGSPPPERETDISPARPLLQSPAAAPASAPAPAATSPPVAGGLPPGVERSVYGVYLVVERGRDRGRAFPINRQVTVLGRSGTEILINDPDISRRHAAIDVQGEGKYVLRDLNSTNGTLLNGVAVQSQSIAPNDKIRMGSTTIKLVIGDDRVAAELARLANETPPT